MNSNILKKFIVFEGVDGAGTSTQCKLLSGKIPGSIPTFEPTDSIIGKMLRDLLKNNTLNHLTLAYLFSADRSEHLYGINGIVSNCNNNKLIISDRYLFSSLAYQSIDLSFEQILDLNNNFPLPQIVFFINTPLDECERRINYRGLDKDIFEKKSIQEKVLANYIKAFDYYKGKNLKLYELDGTKSIDTLLEEEINILKKENII
jgi:dTMP kinase